MNIISQILNFESKNLLIDTLLSSFKNKFISLIKMLFTNSINFNYVKTMLNIQTSINELVKEFISKFFELLDETYSKSIERQREYYLSKRISRTIYTIFGELSFNRYYYVNKNKNNGFFYIDKLFNLEKYKTYDPIIRGLLINDAIHVNPNKTSYHNSLQSLNILDTLSNYNSTIVSRQSIYNWIKELNLNTISYDTINNGKTLYVMADEKWIHKQDKEKKNERKYIMSKCFVVFTGMKRHKGRNKLLGKHIFITSTKSPYKELMDEICKIYDFKKIEVINLLSDAGSWILAGKYELQLYSNNKVVVNTCEFHVKQKISRSTTDKDLREKIAKIIYENEDKKAFRDEMDKLIESKEKQGRKDKITEYKNYIIKHWNGIIAMKYSDIKSSMESHISHCIAEHFGSRPKGYSENTIQKYLKLQEAKLNGINILDLYLKTYNNEEYNYNEKEVNFSLFDKSTSLLPTIASNNPLSLLLNKVAYS